MNQRELRKLLELAVDINNDQKHDRSIYDIAEVLRREIRKKKKVLFRDKETLISIFDTMYYQTLEKNPKYLLKLFPIFSFLCCKGSLDWKIVEEIERNK